ncbi:MAG: Fic family protein [Myxococcales bacterium]|nr:Fic family protein [Myxococcales bacterium]
MADRAAIDTKLESLQEMLATMEEQALAEFQERLDMSWIYHDCALEGMVLSFHELKSAIDKDVVSDVSLIPTYDEIRAHKAAIDWVREQAAKGKKQPITLDLLLKLRDVLNPEPTPPPAPIASVPPPPPVPAVLLEPKPVPTPVLLEPKPAVVKEVKPPPPPAEATPYRRDTPVHRLYFHDIPAADKIAGEMKKLGEWLQEPETKKLPALRLASKLHFKLMQIYPFPKHSGKHARLAMNLVLLRAGYPPAIVHSTERQRYYESLRGPATTLHNIMLESLENAIESAIKLFTEAKSGRRALA